MKVLAKIQTGKFLCEVSDYELRKYMNKFRDFGMDVGREVDLAEGYDFVQDAVKAMEQTEEFISSNKKIIETILKGINVIRKTDDENG